MITHSIYLVAEMHFMWNFLEGIVLGINVSGIHIISTIMKTEYTKDNVLTGGKFGIEGSIATTLVLLVVCSLLYFPNKKQIIKQ